MSKANVWLVAGALALLLILSPVKSNAEDLIIKFEGLRLKAYPDAGSYAIGYGSQWNYDAGRPVISSDVIDAQTALKWLKMRNGENARILDQRVTVPINSNQRDSLLSFIYNIGSAGFIGSTLLKKLNDRRPVNEVADQFDRWIYSQGKVNAALVARRQAEKKLFLS